jgi:hypothetical protein
MLAIVLTQLPWFLVLFLITLVFVSWRKKHHDLSQPKVREVILQADDNWLLYLDAENALPATLLAGSYVQAWLTVLNFHLDQGTRCVVLLTADNVEPVLFRRLRVRLRFPAHTANPNKLIDRE